MRRHTSSLKWAAAILVPFALSGCDLRLAEQEKTAAIAANPAGDSWLIVEQGDPPLPADEVAALPEEEKKEVPHVPAVEHVEAAHHEPRCTGSTPAGVIAALTVTPGATTATVTWYHPGDLRVTTYRITSTSQDLVAGAQPELGWQEKTPGDGCHELTATITGLQRSTPYVFSVDAVRKPTWTNTTRAATVARSGAISTK